MTREDIAEIDPEALFLDGFDDAISGYFIRCAQPLVVTYDRAKCLEVLERDGMTTEEASEYLEFNVTGAWVGDRTPAIICQP